MIHVMVDIEGANTRPSKTRIMQLAAAPFDEYGVLNHLPTFNEFAGVHSQAWTEDSEDTLKFWRAQPIFNEMIATQKKHGVSSITLMKRFNDYLTSLGDRVCLWSCHPQYDMVVIREYYDQLKIEPIWNLKYERDYATVRERYKEALKIGKVTHWAHEDVLRQINILRQCCQLGWELC